MIFCVNNAILSLLNDQIRPAHKTQVLYIYLNVYHALSLYVDYMGLVLEADIFFFFSVVTFVAKMF